jgi:rRNA maturation endonuclease Nob1
MSPTRIPDANLAFAGQAHRVFGGDFRISNMSLSMGLTARSVQKRRRLSSWGRICGP